MESQTNHYKHKRYKREKFINKFIGDGNVIDSFIVDKGHKNGLERHDITDTGLIIIYNARTNFLVTKLIARPKQIKRYYNDTGKKPPRWLLDLAYQHSMLNYNEVW